MGRVPSSFSFILVCSLASCAHRDAPQDEDRVPVGVDAPRQLGQARNAGVTVITATGEARDLAASWVVTAGAAVNGDRVVGWGEGLATVAPGVACALADGTVVVGGADGGLSLIGSDTARTVHLAAAAVNELVCDGASVHVATRLGLYSWTVGAASSVRRLAGADITALAVGPRGLTAGLADGTVFLIGADGKADKLGSGDEPVTALAWVGATLWAGHPDGLDRLEAGHFRRERNDMHVSALLADDSRLLVGTTDSGVLVLGGPGGERRLLGDAHVARLRLAGGRVVAVADGAVYGVADGSPVTGPLPHGLADLAVSGVALLGSEVWVGGEHGVTVLDARGGWLRREALRDSVLTISARPETSEVALGTTAGGLLATATATGKTIHRVGEREGLLGARVAASAHLAGTTAYATDLGVTTIDEIGIAVRFTSGSVLPAGGASAVAWGAGGRLFAGTASGLAVLRGERVEKLLSTGAVYALATGGKGVYVASATGIGLVGPHGLELKAVALGGPTLSSALAVEPAPTGGERIYVATPRGLWVSGPRADGAHGEWQRIGAPLFPSEVVTSVTLDDAAVWIGTDRGLVRLARSLLESTLAPPRS